MKTLYIVPILAIILAVAGCTSGSTGKTVYVTEETPPETVATEAEAPPADIVAPLEVIVVTPEEKSATRDVRIDAVSFLGALVKSGCEIDKAEYKEVIRGGGITVTCKGSTDALDTEGLDGL